MKKRQRKKIAKKAVIAFNFLVVHAINMYHGLSNQIQIACNIAELYASYSKYVSGSGKAQPNPAIIYKELSFYMPNYQPPKGTEGGIILKQSKAMDGAIVSIGGQEIGVASNLVFTVDPNKNKP